MTEGDLTVQRSAAAARKRVLGQWARAEAATPAAEAAGVAAAAVMGPPDASLQGVLDGVLQRLQREVHLEGVASRYKGFAAAPALADLR